MKIAISVILVVGIILYLYFVYKSKRIKPEIDEVIEVGNCHASVIGEVGSFNITISTNEGDYIFTAENGNIISVKNVRNKTFHKYMENY